MLDLSRRGLGVDAALAALLELEMLDRIREIDRRPVEADLLHGLRQEPARRADEGPALAIFLVSRLLAHEHDGGADRAFAEHGLRGAGHQRSGPRR